MKRALNPNKLAAILGLALFPALGCGVIGDAGSVRNLSPGIDLPTIDGPGGPSSGGSPSSSGGASSNGGSWEFGGGGAGGSEVEHFGGGGSLAPSGSSPTNFREERSLEEFPDHGTAGANP